mmetsp:Transcript_21754/g.54707  ORF Transcript_21754/g.54707 Transcript_21754/m.54707 type:complete len:331 (+) Transcript_21754:143-1135(+)
MGGWWGGGVAAGQRNCCCQRAPPPSSTRRVGGPATQGRSISCSFLFGVADTAGRAQIWRGCTAIRLRPEPNARARGEAHAQACRVRSGPVRQQRGLWPLVHQGIQGKCVRLLKQPRSAWRVGRGGRGGVCLCLPERAPQAQHVAKVLRLGFVVCRVGLVVSRRPDLRHAERTHGLLVNALPRFLPAGALFPAVLPPLGSFDGGNISVQLPVHVVALVQRHGLNALDLAVPHPNDAVCKKFEPHVVRHHHECHAMVFVQVGQQLHHDACVHCVKVTGGLIQQQDTGLVGHGTCNRHALLLTARELCRQVVHTVLHAHGCQQLHRASAPLLP